MHLSALADLLCQSKAHSPRPSRSEYPPPASSPTAMRIRPSLIPAARAAGEMRHAWWSAGWLIVVLVSPNSRDGKHLRAIDHAPCRCLPPSLERHACPPVFCCFSASACCGCDGRPDKTRATWVAAPALSSCSAFALCASIALERLDPEKHPRVERAHGRAGGAPEAVHRLISFCCPAPHAQPRPLP